MLLLPHMEQTKNGHKIFVEFRSSNTFASSGFSSCLQSWVSHVCGSHFYEERSVMLCFIIHLTYYKNECEKTFSTRLSKGTKILCRPPCESANLVFWEYRRLFLIWLLVHVLVMSLNVKRRNHSNNLLMRLRLGWHR